MRRWGRLYLILALFIAAIVLITSGTMAFYNMSHDIAAQLRTAGYVLKVNESTAVAQSLADMVLAPGDTLSRDVKIDTSGLDAATTLTVTLTVQASGALPPGFSAYLNGAAATGSGNLSVTRTVDNAQKQIIPMTVTVSWPTGGGNLSQYKHLEISYQVTVCADQKAGG